MMRLSRRQVAEEREPFAHRHDAPVMYRRVSARRRITCAIQRIISTPGAASSQRYSGWPERQRVEVDARDKHGR